MIAASATRLLQRGAELRLKIHAEDITFTALDDSATATIKAIVTSGASSSTLTEGGFYLQDAMTAEILTSDLPSFDLAAEMFVDARGKEMRIAADGITPGLINYRLTLVPRKVPAAR